jgi:hypothetical protein
MGSGWIGVGVTAGIMTAGLVSWKKYLFLENISLI